MNTKVDVARIQSRLKEMAVATANVLETYGIPYMIAFGTLLGAIRHKGFIPWDDDFDFFLFDDSYNDAIKILREKLPKSFFVEDKESEPKYFHAWAHVKDLNSICTCEHFPHDSSYEHKGISLDLYRMNHILEKDYSSFRLTEALKYIERRKTLGLITDEDYQMRKEKYMGLFQPDGVTSEDVVLAFTTSHKCVSKLRLEDVFPLKKIAFDDVMFLGPQKPEKILRIIYGDNYMELPPMEQRFPHSSSVIFL